MQIYPTMFPEHRRTDPTRQAELRVYNELLNSDLDGLAGTLMAIRIRFKSVPKITLPDKPSL